MAFGGCLLGEAIYVSRKQTLQAKSTYEVAIAITYFLSNDIKGDI